MIRSMTGFGRVALAQTPYIIEISGVNRKQLEIKCSLPKHLSSYEYILRTLIAKRITRGTVFVRIDCSALPGNLPQKILNIPLVKALYAQAKQLAESLNTSPPQLGEILLIPGLINEPEATLIDENFENVLTEYLQLALDEFEASKAREGTALANDFLERIGDLMQTVDELENLCADLPNQMRDKMVEKIQDYNLEIPLDEERLSKELFYFVQRVDVTEELTRLRSHLEQLSSMIGGVHTGRSMEFQIQEIQREITTLGNKANGIEISSKIVMFKTEVERMKEQVQNVE